MAERGGWSIASMARFCRMDAEVFEARMASGDVDEAMARRIGTAFGTSAQLWINLGVMYREWERTE